MNPQTQTIKDYFSLDAPAKQLDLNKTAALAPVSPSEPTDDRFGMLGAIVVTVIAGVLAGVGIPVFL